jgi:hypothetical protein
MVQFERHSVAPGRPSAKPGRFVFTYRCCDDPRTDSKISIGLPFLLDEAEVRRLCAVHAANVESRHEAKVIVEAHLRSLLGRGIATKDSAGIEHVCRIAAVEHAADEIVRVRYQCCGAKDVGDLHVAEIDRVHWHTPDEVNAFIQGHIKDAADHCSVRSVLAGLERIGGEAGTAT